MGKSKKRIELTEVRILQAALNLADRTGIETFTIRRLAAELGSGTMSIYHYFSSKEMIIDSMVEAVFAEIELPPQGSDWKTAIRLRSFSARTVLRKHFWVPPLMDSRKSPGANTLSHHDAVIGCLRRGGLSISLTSKAVAILDSFIYGFALQEANLPGAGGEDMINLGRELAAGPVSAYPNLLELTQYVTGSEYNFDEIFGHGIDLIIDGLERESGLSS